MQMATPDLPDRVDLLERLQDQQARINAQLIEVTARLGEEHALYAERQARDEQILARLAAAHALHEERFAQHEEQMAELRQLLQAIKDMLPRGNGH
jgi:non-ribosomal peptide synthetase component F